MRLRKSVRTLLFSRRQGRLRRALHLKLEAPRGRLQERGASVRGEQRLFDFPIWYVLPGFL